MKNLLAGAAAAAVVIAIGAAAWMTFAPRPAPPPPPATDGIDTYARQLDRPGLRYVGTEDTTAAQRPAYSVTYAASDPALKRGRTAAENAARQAEWRKRFCTDALAADMKAQGVTVVSGRVVDDAGTTQYVADCVAGQPAPRAGPGGPLL